MFLVNRKVQSPDGREGKVLHIHDRKALIRWSGDWTPEWVSFEELRKR